MSIQTAGITVGIPASDIVATRVSARLGLLDASRLIAAAGIVWVHVTATESGASQYPTLYPLGTFGVPFYLFIAMLFMSRSITRDPSLPLKKYYLSRLMRVYIPFLAWTAIYCLLTELKHLSKDHHLGSIPLSVLYAGGHMHLWFLTYLMVVSAIGAAIVRYLHDKPALQPKVALLFLIIGIGFCIPPEPAWISHRDPRWGDKEFLEFAFRALPTTFWSMAMVLAVGMKGTLPKTSARVAIGGVMLWICAMLAMNIFEPIRVLRGLAGFGLVLFALWPVRAGLIEKVGSLGKYSFGVYLSHVMFVRIFILWMQRYDYQPTAAFLVMEFAIVFACSLGLSILLSQSKYTRWVIGE